MSIEMKTCMLWGDLSSDRTSEQYPEAPVCTDCIAEQAGKGENSCIVSVGGNVVDRDATCALCDAGFDA
jgi:hypothetical protein